MKADNIGVRLQTACLNFRSALKRAICSVVVNRWLPGISLDIQYSTKNVKYCLAEFEIL